MVTHKSSTMQDIGTFYIQRIIPIDGSDTCVHTCTGDIKTADVFKTIINKPTQLTRTTPFQCQFIKVHLICVILKELYC